MIKTCNLCSGEVEYTDSSKVYWGKSYGMIYLCKRCGAFVGVHKGTNQPLGTLADGELRAMRKATHELFDFLWKKFKKDDSVRRGQYYKKLAELIGKGYVENRQHGDTRFMEYKLRDDVLVTHISEQEIELGILSPSL